ncbi:MAG: hypothetical protein ACI9CE_003845 [Flavobacterium sp.]|jgi:hypothetical protein
MKIFIPISDALLSERGELKGALVPFAPELLTDKSKKGRPNNWLSEDNYSCARKRLGNVEVRALS